MWYYWSLGVLGRFVWCSAENIIAPVADTIRSPTDSESDGAW